MRLTHGSELLENQRWQPLPGDEHAQIFPYIRKVDTNSSNSYIISTPSQIILIDPGGLMEQMDLLATEIERIRTVNPRPVFIYLTHTHVDHFVVIQSHPFFNGPVRPIIAAHATGAASLETADTASTQADLFQIRLTPLHVPMQLFAPTREHKTDFFEICPLVAPCVRVQESDITVDDTPLPETPGRGFRAAGQDGGLPSPGPQPVTASVSGSVACFSLATCCLRQARGLPVFVGGASRISSHRFTKSTGSWITKISGSAARDTGA